eukprot:SAG11_NODE_10070_length_858_cov_2.363636_2_plen_113_part_00
MLPEERPLLKVIRVELEAFKLAQVRQVGRFHLRSPTGSARAQCAPSMAVDTAESYGIMVPPKRVNGAVITVSLSKLFRLALADTWVTRRSSTHEVVPERGESFETCQAFEVG